MVALLNRQQWRRYNWSVLRNSGGLTSLAKSLPVGSEKVDEAISESLWAFGLVGRYALYGQATM